MRIFFLGDIVGKSGCDAVKKNLSNIISSQKIDFVDQQILALETIVENALETINNLNEFVFHFSIRFLNYHDFHL